uniref:Thyroglobulin type-1 domain-containing protein n=1 Tax=Erpetoichthys calabaricus TaxID=27687 RepID=A0A8C4SRQ3_ERPCA
GCTSGCDEYAAQKGPGIPFEGVYIPQCDEAGNYRPLQCHESTSHCWCVDAKGQERPGTRTYPGTSPANCDQPGNIQIMNVSPVLLPWLLYIHCP